MHVEIKYQDETGRVITEQEKSVLELFITVTFEDGFVKKTEKLGYTKRHGNYRIIEYYLDPTEDKDDILRSYSDGQTTTIIYFNRQAKNEFTFWNTEGYSRDGILKRKDIVVYNEKHWEVMYCQLDLNEGHPIYSGTKFFYGNVFPNKFDDVLFQFHYNADGTLDTISDYNNIYDFGQGSEDLETFLSIMESMNPDFHWEQHPYFHSLKPYLPETKEL